MAIDRGGLEYKIEVKDSFSTETQRFRDEIDKSKAAFAAFRAQVESSRGLTTDLTTGLAAARTESTKLRSSAEGRAKAEAAITSNLAAQNTVIGRQNRLTRTQARQQVSAARDVRRSTQNTAKEAKRVQDRTAAVRKNLRGAAGEANRISFTFRRLFGILAAFAAARLLIQGFVQTIAQAVQLSARLEQIQIGTAAVLSSVAEIRDGFGNVVEGTDRFNAALTLSRSIINQLKRDSLLTLSTFDDLSQNFQTALGPGLAAGLDIDQIRRFTLQISQAAAVIGLEQNQLAEEVRSLFTGTITPRTTRIATVLGITNEDIRNQREAGTLFEFLNARFSEFDALGENVQRTFFGLVSNARDFFGQFLRSGAVEFMTELKGVVSDVIDLLRDNNVSDSVQIDPEAVNVARDFFGILASGVAEARAFIQALNFNDVQNALQGFGALATEAFSALRVILNVVFRVLGNVGSIIGTIVNAIRALFSVINSLSGGLLSQLGSVATTMLTWLITVRLLISTFSGIRGAIVFIANLTLGTNLATAAFIRLRAAVSAFLTGFGPATVLFLAITFLTTGLLAAKETTDDTTASTNRYGRSLQDVTTVLGKNARLLSISAETAEKLRDSAQAAQRELDLANTLQGVRGLAAVPFEIDSNVRDRFKKEIEKVVTDVRIAEEALLASQKNIRNQFNLGFGAFNIRDQERVNDFIDAQEEVNFNQARLQALTTDLRREEVNLELARKANSATAIASSEARVESIQQELEAEKALTNVLVEEALEAREKLNSSTIQSANTIIGLRSKERTLDQELIQLKQTEVDLETAISEEINDRIRTRISNQIPALREQIRLQGDLNRIAIQTARTRIEAQQVSDIELLSRKTDALVEQTQARIDSTERAIALERSLSRVGISRAQEEIDRIKEKIRVSSDELDFSEQLAAAEERLSLIREIAAAREEGNLVKLQRLRQRFLFFQRDLNQQLNQERAPALSGLVQGLRDVVNEATNTFERIRQLVKDVAREINRSLSDAIVDAFDPNNTEGTRERVSRFFRSVGRIFVENAVEQLTGAVTALLIEFTAALARALAQSAAFQGLAATISGAGLNVTPAGRKHGGPIPSRHAIANYHNTAKGYHTGGSPRPGHLHPADTVPIWAQPGEWMIRLASVRKYGSAVMDKINQGLINPTGLHALAASASSVKRTRVGPGLGFQTGGSIPQAQTRTNPAQGGSPSDPVPAVILANEQTMDRLLAGGKRAVFRFMEQNKSAIAGLLQTAQQGKFGS